MHAASLSSVFLALRCVTYGLLSCGYKYCFFSTAVNWYSCVDVCMIIVLPINTTY